MSKSKQQVLSLKESQIAAQELHRPITKVFERRKVLANHMDWCWAADLVVMDKQDYRYKYILVIIDIYTRYAWASPLTTKTPEATKAAFEEIFKTSKRNPKYLWCDRGMEFYSSIFTAFLQQNNIKLYSTESELKSCCVERLNNTLKHKMQKQITVYQLSKRPIHWIQILPKIVKEYNNIDVHRFHGMTPHYASQEENQPKLDEIWKEIFLRSLPERRETAKFKVGDYVRLYRYKKAFEKGYKWNFTPEVFLIKKLLPTNPITYIIQDSTGEEIKGGVYEQELTKTAFKFI